MSCVLYRIAIAPFPQFPCQYEMVNGDRSGTNVAIVRCSSDLTNPKEPKIKCDNIRKNSILIKNAQVRTVFEYFPG